MIISIILFLISFWLIYTGYKYKAILTFIFGAVVNDVIRYLKMKKMCRCQFDEKRNAYYLKFVLKDSFYEIVIPNEATVNSNKILALSGSINKTLDLTQKLGPLNNFFGFNPTLQNLNIEPPLNIWVGKTRYRFNESDKVVSFDIKNIFEEDSDVEE